ncbi:MAG: glycosyl hydrolase family 28 protein [Eubacteriales bacterium]|nr:glycosyl hydrolase family 28 protein [Eubacteriales bacterium]
MLKGKRNCLDKLNTLLFGKDLRVTEGEPYTEVREYDFSSYFPIENYIVEQSIPTENVFDIRDFGADVNNEDNAEYINFAIDKASKCNGTVLVDGGEYVTTAVTLKSGVTLFISKNSALSSNKTGKGYGEKKAVLYANGVKDITLTGGGKIKGNGNYFGRKPVADKNNTIPPKYIDVIEMRKDYRAQLRFAHPSKYGGLIYFYDCKNVKVNNFTLENSAYWTFKISNCENIDIKNLVINNNRHVANADGIDIAGTSNVKIKHCFISTADDGIVIKNANWLGNKGPMENIEVTDCEIISRANSIKVGTETTYDISKIRISDCKLLMTDVYPGTVSAIALEACDGTVLSDIVVKNIITDRCSCPIFIRLGNRNRASKVNSANSNIIEFGGRAPKGSISDKSEFDMKSQLNDVVIENVKSTGVELPVIIAGFKQRGRIKRVKNVTLKNIDIDYADIPETVDKRLFIPEYADVYPECWRFRNLPAYALWIRHAENVKIENFNCNHPQPTWKKDVIKEDLI